MTQLRPKQATVMHSDKSRKRLARAKATRRIGAFETWGKLEPYFDLIGEAALETLWPTRCCLCDRPGTPLCKTCCAKLPYIDQLWSCPTCGAAFGKLICTECNHYTLSRKGFDEFPLDGCRSCARATADVLKVVSTYKDKGDQALADTLAEMLSWSLPPTWHDFSLVPIPARPAALKRRGFDHIGLVVQKLARKTGMHRQDLLVSKNGLDQRTLGATSRAENARGAFGLRNPKAPPKNVVLIDDVMTTGSTLTVAADTLKSAGAQTVVALTFTRV